MAQADKVFEQTYDWYRSAVAQAVAALPAAQRPVAEQLLWQMLGMVQARLPVPADADLAAFSAPGATADSLAVAAQTVAEVLVLLEQLAGAVAGLQGGQAGPALAAIGPVVRQIQNLQAGTAHSRYPSAFSLGKMLLALSGDAQVQNPAPGQEAARLAQLLGAGNSRAGQTALAWLCLLAGGMLDRSFTQPSAASAAAMLAGTLPAPDPAALRLPQPLQLPGGSIAVDFKTDAPTGLVATLNLAVQQQRQLNQQSFALTLKATGNGQTFLPVQPPGRLQTSGTFDLTIGLKRSKADGALVIGPHRGASLRIGELGVELVLKNGAPLLRLFARQGRALLEPEDPFLKLVLGQGIALDFSVEALADQFGRLRLQNGSGLSASLPVPTLPTGPFQLQRIQLDIAPQGGSFLQLQAALSAAFGVQLGPFQAAIEGMGLQLELDCRGATPQLAFAFKPPTGIGLALDAGVVKGGGFLGVAPGGYAGTLELQLLAIGVKAIAILDTRGEAGFSLLLLVYGQFPPVQLSFGFTLTGVGGLIGVQHGVDHDALARGLANGALDAILFPKNPVADAPRIIATLRTLFPVRQGGFVIGPMLELGWGTPSLVTVRMGLLIEPAEGSITILGQAIVQLPPLVDAGLALLRLQMDFRGGVRTDPLSIYCDAMLRDSRVGFVTLTGQFAFRASFGERPSFVLSAGGFHPRFKEVPGDIPAPFQRVGAAFDIGVVGVSFQGYFAITSATVQMGSALRIWADLEVASLEGGFSFDAICTMQPRFRFEVDLRAYVALEVLGGDFAAVRVTGSLSGPGRWRLRGRCKLELPLLPDVEIDIDEGWGTDRDTPVVSVPLPQLVAAEIANTANWSAQLPQGGEACVTVADIRGVTGLLAHPLGTLVFQQKLVPLELRLDKVGGSRIDGANEYFAPRLDLSQDGVGAQELPPRHDFFAAAQFLELSEDERLDLPSFESYPAGYALSDDGFAFGTPIAAPLDYEIDELGVAQPRGRVPSMLAFDATLHAPMLRAGAAGRSSLRDKRLHQPVVDAAVRVQPAPVVATGRATLDTLSAQASAAPHASVWQTRRALAASVPGSLLRRVQVAEVHELLR